MGLALSMRVREAGQRPGLHPQPVPAAAPVGWHLRHRVRSTSRRAGAGAALALVAVIAAALLVQHSGTTAPAASAVHSLPLAARGVVSATLGREEKGYDIVGLRASNPAQDFQTSFSAGGATITAGAARLQLGIDGYGPPGALRAIPGAQPHASANRVTYSHGAVTEWYVNGPLGLEQGFDVSAPPAGGSARIALAVRLGGDMRARLAQGGLLFTGRGSTLRYGDLLARDAHGRVLPASLRLSGGRALIEVDARGAAYPLDIDPFTSKAELRAGDETADSGFGVAVAISGSTLVVGADTHERDTGAAYVFTTTNGWSSATQAAELTANPSNYFFGETVAISENESTIVVGAGHAAYVFVKPGGGWAAEANQTQTSKLAAPGESPQLDDTSVATTSDGKTVVLGVPGQTINENTPEASVDQGALFVYTEPSGGWKEAPPSASSISASDGKEKDLFGWATAISANGSTIVTGAPAEGFGSNAPTGRAYILTKPAAGWSDTSGIGTVEVKPSNLTAGARFGTSVASSETGGDIAVGAPGFYYNTGVGFVFVQPAGGWGGSIKTAVLRGFGEIGDSIAISSNGQRVVTGAQGYEEQGGESDGRLFVYGEPAGGWSGREPIGDESATPAGAIGNGLIGSSAALSGTTIVTGAPGEGVESAGRGYLFTLPTFTPSAAETSEEVLEGPGKEGPGGKEKEVIKNETPTTTTGTSTSVQQVVIKAPFKKSIAEINKEFFVYVDRELERLWAEEANGFNPAKELLTNGGTLGMTAPSPTAGTVSLNGTGGAPASKSSVAAVHHAAVLFTGTAHLVVGVKPRLKIKLTRAGRTALEAVVSHHRTLSVLLEITYTIPGAATTHGSVKVTIRPPKHKQSKHKH